MVQKKSYYFFRYLINEIKTRGVNISHSRYGGSIKKGHSYILNLALRSTRVSHFFYVYVCILIYNIYYVVCIRHSFQQLFLSYRLIYGLRHHSIFPSLHHHLSLIIFNYLFSVYSAWLLHRLWKNMAMSWTRLFYVIFFFIIIIFYNKGGERGRRKGGIIVYWQCIVCCSYFLFFLSCYFSCMSFFINYYTLCIVRIVQRKGSAPPRLYFVPYILIFFPRQRTTTARTRRIGTVAGARVVAWLCTFILAQQTCLRFSFVILFFYFYFLLLLLLFVLNNSPFMRFSLFLSSNSRVNYYLFTFFLFHYFIILFCTLNTIKASVIIIFSAFLSPCTHA